MVSKKLRAAGGGGHPPCPPIGKNGVRHERLSHLHQRPEPEPEPEGTLDIFPMPDTDTAPDERRRRQAILTRLGTSRASAARLARKAAEAEAVIGMHGVSVTAGPETREHSRALRLAVAAQFRIHDTPTRRDPLHRTVELPKPVAQHVVDRFNRVFGRL
jgi:hypothetical protein